MDKLDYMLTEFSESSNNDISGNNSKRLHVLVACCKLTGVARTQAIRFYSTDFALDGVIYIGFPKLCSELIAQSQSVGLKLVDRHGITITKEFRPGNKIKI